MSAGEVSIRVATLDDAAQILAIYTPYVERTALTFERVPPTYVQQCDRIAKVLEFYPYLVAERDGRVVGYCYASRFRVRRAYDWAVETSIYTEMDSRNKGVGGKLYRALELALRKQGILNMCACVAFPSKPDEYASTNSVEFHGHMGFRIVGEFDRCGSKFGRWYNMVWMEKHIGVHEENPEPPVPFEQVREEVERELGIR